MCDRRYRNYEPTYPASGRLHSVPPRHYDVYDEFGDLVLSDVIHNTRAKSMARERMSRRDGWVHPCYRDMVEQGRGASPGHYFPRSSTEYSREILSRRSQSPCSVPETFNRMNREFTESVREKLHRSKQTAMYPETFRASSAGYNPVLGRYMRTADSPGFKFYRFGNSYSDYPASMKPTPTRYSTRLTEVIYVPKYT